MLIYKKSISRCINILIVLLTICTIQTKAQELPIDTQVNYFGIKKFYQADRKINNKELRKILNSYPVSEDLIQKSKTNMIVGTSILVIGLPTLFYGGMVHWFETGSPALFIIAPLIPATIGIALIRRSRNQKYDSIYEYNKNLKGRNTSGLYLNAVPNGIGLQWRF